MELYKECYDDNFEKIKSLFENTNINLLYNDKYQRNYFHIACKNGNLEIIKYLLIKTEDIISKYQNISLNNIINKPDYEGNTPFHLACIYNHIELINFLLTIEKIDINKRDRYGCTAFYRICLDKNFDLIKILLKNDRININQGDNYGMTPFHTFCCFDNLDMIKLFLENPRIDINKKTINLELLFIMLC